MEVRRGTSEMGVGESVEYFETIGNEVDRAWRALDHNERSFPDLALAVLEANPPCRHVSLFDIAKWGILSRPLLRQNGLNYEFGQAPLTHGYEFGQPPLTVYQGQGFYIEVLFWTEGLTAIHQHSFSGAFHVLAGSSLHCQYTFDLRERVNGGFLLGETALVHAELLLEGSSRPIAAGRNLVHATFHLDRPSVSVVIRTRIEPEALPQYSYLRPFVALDPSQLTPEVTRRVQVLEMLLAAGLRTQFDDLVRHALNGADLPATFRILQTCWKAIKDGDEREVLLQIARSRHGERVDRVQAVLDEQERQELLLDARRRLFNPDHRLLLALLLNVPNRRMLLEVIRRRFPARDPVDVVSGWVADLSRLETPDLPGGVLFGVAFDEAWMLLFRCLLRGLDQQGIERQFAAVYGASETKRNRTHLIALTESLRTSAFFGDLLAPGRQTRFQGSTANAMTRVPRRSITS
jgi:hypothetical protein